MNLLNEVPLNCYDKYRNLLQKDIDTIDRTNIIMNSHSCDVITLKQASEINKKYKEHEDIFQKIMDGEYDQLQNFSFDVVRFAFSRYYNNKPYLSDMTQILQDFILRNGVLGLKIFHYDYSSEFLNHSLQKNPSDITITEGKIIDTIYDDKFFKNKINEIIEKYGNDKNFYTGEKKESLAFENGDLFFSLHNSYIDVIGNKQEDNKWNLDITLSDDYDFTDFQELKEYISDEDVIKAFVGSTGNNLAMIGTACKVVNKYNITIKFKIENWEV